MVKKITASIILSFLGLTIFAQSALLDDIKIMNNTFIQNQNQQQNQVVLNDLNRNDIFKEYVSGPIKGGLSSFGLSAYGIRSPIYKLNNKDSVVYY